MKSEKLDFEKEKGQYPRMVVFDDGNVVLLYREECGICIHAEKSNNYIGEYSEEWAEGIAKPFTGKIILEN